MYARYKIVDREQRIVLGNNSASAYSSSVLADWVGMLTGTITNTTQLSAYADKPECLIQGAVGDWTVYDTDAHPSFPGKCKVLRRPTADGLNHQYIFIGFSVLTVVADCLIGTLGFMGGWDSVAKKPTTPMVFTRGTSTVGTTYRVLPENTVLSSTNCNLNDSSANNSTYYYGGGIYGVFNTWGINTTPSVPYVILSTNGLFTFWGAPSSGANEFPNGMIAEYNPASAFNTPSAGIPPYVYGASGYNNDYMFGIIPRTKNSLGELVNPSATTFRSLLGSGGSFYHTSNGLTAYGRDGTGAKVIPIIPIDMTASVAGGDVFSYVGRLKSVYATMASLQTGDTFIDGADTYVVIPTGGYSSNLQSHSSSGKLCAKVQ